MDTTQTAAVGTATKRKPFVGTGDFTRERHEGPQRTMEERCADIRRLQAEHPERLTIPLVR